MQELNRYKKMVLVAAGGLIIAVGAYGGLWYWISSMQSDIETLQISLDVETRKEKRHRLLREAVRNTEDVRSEMETYIVSPREIVDVIERIETLGTEAGAPVTFESVTTEDQQLLLDFSAEGTFFANYYLLSLLETLPLQYTLDRYWIEQPENQEGTQPWKSTVRMTIQGFVR